MKTTESFVMESNARFLMEPVRSQLHLTGMNTCYDI